MNVIPTNSHLINMSKWSTLFNDIEKKICFTVHINSKNTCLLYQEISCFDHVVSKYRFFSQNFISPCHIKSVKVETKHLSEII